MTTTKVYANLKVGLRRRVTASSQRAACYRIELVARGTGTVMYRTTVCATELKAVFLAANYLRKNRDWLIDTTTTNGGGWYRHWHKLVNGDTP